jgi:hypothetical protein
MERRTGKNMRINRKLRELERRNGWLLSIGSASFVTLRHMGL